MFDNSDKQYYRKAGRPHPKKTVKPKLLTNESFPTSKTTSPQMNSPSKKPIMAPIDYKLVSRNGKVMKSTESINDRVKETNEEHINKTKYKENGDKYFAEYGPR